MKRACEQCGKAIPVLRLEALPGTRTCVRCSHVRVRSSDEPGLIDDPWDSTDQFRQISHEGENK